MNPQSASAVLYGLFLVSLGAAAMLALGGALQSRRRSKIAAEAMAILDVARREAEVQRDAILVAAREAALAIRAAADEVAAAARIEERAGTRKLDRREEQLAAAAEALRKNEAELQASQTRIASQIRGLTEQRGELDRTLTAQKERLQTIAGMTPQQAAEQMRVDAAAELETELGSMILRQRQELTERVDAEARDMLMIAMQRYASRQTAETTTSTVGVPSDDMKGRIIGREGRNIRAFEAATGVDLIIDDTPGVVVVSGFDPIRREVARQSLEELIADGRIHPTRIEESVEKTRQRLDEFIEQQGHAAIAEVGLASVSDKVITELGKLHFRTSFSQNVLRHSVEVAWICGLIAEMIGLDADLARRAGLFHDIGKGADHELEGGHPKIGSDLLRRAGEPEAVVHAALGHHDEIVTAYPYTVVTATADAISASRPGARRESLHRYVKRMEELESIAQRYDGVESAYAISAGRELRVMISSGKITDHRAAMIGRDIAKAFEKELTYPGEIKVTVVRETRFTAVAK